MHAQMPGSLDAYYQEAGRGGRDGEPARCILLFDLKDKQVQQFFLGGRYPTVEMLRRVAETVRALTRASESGILEKPLERLHEALPNVGMSKLRVVTTLLNDIGMTRRTRRGGMKAIDEGGAMEKIDKAAAEYALRAESDRAVLERTITYAQSAQCRWRMLLDYFTADVVKQQSRVSYCEPVLSYRMPTDELGGERCGTCDNCLNPPTVEESPRESRMRVPTTKTTRSFDVGDTVRARRYGEGTVEMVSGDCVAVRFSDDEVRTFIARYIQPVASSAAPAEDSR
ncbi:RecQ family zinc-binding domain-containing protein [Caballeronia arvi]|uniref:RecQ family zinc-binding domain-containing protein n=1 Tax=Caballeronia arvi TaxID=1777135 RepID=UPI002E133828